MVRATIFASTLFALVAVVTAIPLPAGSLVDVDGCDHIGTGDINADSALQNVVNANDLNVEDVGYDINALDGDDDYDGVNSGNSGSSGNGGYNPCSDSSGTHPSQPNRGACGGSAEDHGLLDHVLKRSEISAAVMKD